MKTISEDELTQYLEEVSSTCLEHYETVEEKVGKSSKVDRKLREDALRLGAGAYMAYFSDNEVAFKKFSKVVEQVRHTLRVEGYYR